MGIFDTLWFLFIIIIIAILFCFIFYFYGDTDSLIADVQTIWSAAQSFVKSIGAN